MSKKIMGVYKILNKVNNKWYVGSSRNVIDRLKRHKKGLNSNKHSNNHLLNAWNKYGADSFEFSIIQTFDNVDLMLNLEQRLLDENFDKGVLYNKVRQARISTEEILEVNRLKHLNKPCNFSNEQIELMRQQGRAGALKRWNEMTPEKLALHKEKASISGRKGYLKLLEKNKNKILRDSQGKFKKNS